MSKIFRVVITALAFVWAAGVYSSSLAGITPVITDAPTGFDGLTNGALAFRNKGIVSRGPLPPERRGRSSF